jgi:hypothetical protein
MDDLWKFLQTNNSQDGKFYHVYDDFEKSDYYQYIRAYLSNAQSTYERLIETEDVNECLTYKSQEKINPYLLNRLIINKYDQETFASSKKEFDAISDIRGKEEVPYKFIMVGCGPLAQTLLHFGLTYRESCCVGIDNNLEAIESFNKIKNYFKLDNIDCKLVDGTNYNYTSFEVVFVANFATPKQKILQRIGETAMLNSILVIRLPVLYSNLFYESVEYKSIQGFEVVRELTINNNMMNKTVILRKTS